METKHSASDASCGCRRHAHRCEHWGLWLLAAVLGVLYVIGKRQRPKIRFVEEMDTVSEPEEVQAWMTVSRMPQFHLMRKLLVQHALKGRLTARVLDVGSGVGRLTMLLARQPQVTEAVGIDLSDALVHQARQTAEEQGIEARFMQVDAAEMPFADASFDVVVSAFSLHHWSNPQQVLSEMRRVLAPGGQAYIFDFRRDARPLFYGLATVIAHCLAPRIAREHGEPVSSLQSAYTAPEIAILAYKAGWPNPSVSNKGPAGLLLELKKDEC